MNFALQNVPLPLRFRTEVPMTDEELMRFCAVNEALRVEREPNGDLLVMTPAGKKSGMRNFEIIGFLHSWAQSDGCGYGFDCNTGFNLPDGSMRSPDAAWIGAARLDPLTEEEGDRYVPLCPEFVIELRSASDRLPDVEAKMEQWMANGAELGWLIDPQLKRVTIYRAGREAEQLDGPAMVVGDGPVAGFELPMARIWK
jgi:Uma2 family endonuclease